MKCECRGIPPDQQGAPPPPMREDVEAEMLKHFEFLCDSTPPYLHQVLRHLTSLAAATGAEKFAIAELMEHAAMVDAAMPDVVLDGRDLHAALAEQRQRADAEKGANRDS